MYGLAAIAGGNILKGYGDYQAARATQNELGNEYNRQQGYNQQVRQDLEQTLPKFGGPALRGDINTASAPLYATQQQNVTLGKLLGQDLGASGGVGVEGGTADAIRRNQYGISAFGLRRAQEMEDRTLGDLISRRQRIAARAEESANLLPYNLRVAGLKGGEYSTLGDVLSTSGQYSMGQGSGK